MINLNGKKISKAEKTERLFGAFRRLGSKCVLPSNKQYWVENKQKTILHTRCEFIRKFNEFVIISAKQMRPKQLVCYDSAAISVGKRTLTSGPCDGGFRLKSTPPVTVTATVIAFFSKKKNDKKSRQNKPSKMSFHTLGWANDAKQWDLLSQAHFRRFLTKICTLYYIFPSNIQREKEKKRKKKRVSLDTGCFFLFAPCAIVVTGVNAFIKKKIGVHPRKRRGFRKQMKEQMVSTLQE